MLNRIAELKYAIQEFMTSKNKKSFEFDDFQFMADFAFFTDISSHLATVNHKLMIVLYSHAKAFQAKLKLSEQQLGNRDLSHFP